MFRSENQRSYWRSPAGLLLCGLLVLLALYLWMEHQVHVLAIAPLLLPLLICVVMHVFMHAGHAHGAGGDRGERPDGEDRRLG